ncbi:tetratricopeptide repeat protein [Cooperia oncophora]
MFRQCGAVRELLVAVATLIWPFVGVRPDRAEPASAIRKRQNEMLADEYVVRGVEHMRSGNREAAIVVLNQALDINPHCVEALVARGAA